MRERGDRAPQERLRRLSSLEMRDVDFKLERRYEDKNMGMIRKSLKLYEFTEHLNRMTRTSPSRVVEMNDADADDLAEEIMAGGDSKGGLPSQGSIRREMGAVGSWSSSQMSDITLEDEVTGTSELNPIVFVSHKSPLWPNRSLMARIGFAVAMPMAECRRELQIALNQTSDCCLPTCVYKESVIIDVFDSQLQEVVGTAEVRVDQENIVGRDELSPWNSPQLLSLVHFDTLVDSQANLQENLLLLYARVRYHFDSLLEADPRASAKSNFLVLPPRAGEQVFEVLESEDGMISRPASTVSAASSDDSPSNRVISSCLTSRKRPDKCLKDLGRRLGDVGYVVRQRPGFGLEIELGASRERPKVVYADAQRSGSGGGVTELTMHMRVSGDATETDVFRRLCESAKAISTENKRLFALR
eukprot:CAMPEP_0198327464 /NCGR_PEP_ID=MMETSP1450-20131203/14720_1 /TAXON_ID=753684 ORGANISM="Madagascaria erythrocladiodes, Strain CCMP3234" /NCGR_SAMPLE_ID=MMETSP1450 /ASSEMBLY_ACC=CAM_ASM_001115 /LENGTH=415 /DNA_ID=CAMNT_0044031511 /DNA_START=187 /DNA_END=1434 /DNA_ORIENTATION=-